MNAYLNAMQRYFDFAGRSTRSQYWLYMLTFVLLIIAAIIIDGFAGNLEGDGPAFVTGIVNVVHLIPNWSVTVRRLHDTGRSGWWVLLGFVPLVGQIVLLVWLCGGSKAGANRFGDTTSDDLTSPPRWPANEPQLSIANADLDRLEKLSRLKASGAINDSEFLRLKSETLGQRDAQ